MTSIFSTPGSLVADSQNAHTLMNEEQSFLAGVAAAYACLLTLLCEEKAGSNKSCEAY